MNRLKELKREIESADLPLKNDATNLVLYRGNPDAKVVFVGEAPGKNEDEQGLPFVGRSGTLLDEAIEQAGLTTYYITNIVKYRPPENRNPYVDEMKSHGEWLWRELSIISPVIVVPLGNTATKFFMSKIKNCSFSSVDGVSLLRGKRVEGKSFVVFPTFHPAATMYDRKKRPVFFEDISRVSGLLDG